MDCWGLVFATAKDCKLSTDALNTEHNYSRVSDGELETELRKYCGEPLEVAFAGCIVSIRWPGIKKAGHLGIFTGENLIHAYSRTGRAVEHGFRGTWLKMASGFWRVPGVAYE